MKSNVLNQTNEKDLKLKVKDHLQFTRAHTHGT